MAWLLPPFKSTFIDYPSKDDIAVMAFFVGCENICPNCHNIKLKNPIEVETCIGLECKELDFFVNSLSAYASRCHTNKIVLTGGDPLYKENILFIKRLVKKYNKQFDFCIYTGYNIEKVKDENISGFKYIKCGCYNEKLAQPSVKTDEFMRLASSNQKLYNEDLKLISKNGIYKF